MTLDLVRMRFHFRALDRVCFPGGGAANVLRGALGLLLGSTGSSDTEQIFSPHMDRGGPSGLADRPRPFVFRARHLNGVAVEADREFHFDLHLFDTRDHARASVMAAFREIATEGIGLGRGRAALVSVDQKPHSVELDGGNLAAGRVSVHFLTPTELKSGEEVAPRPEFGALFARLRDRISTLRALYGAGPLEIDFRAMGERALAVTMTRCELEWNRAQRTSGRTGQTHPLGGFTGAAEYEGELGEFLPYLRAGEWTGVGRQTVWGKGEICCSVVS
ncbi:MAG: CRISPR system precrRNA processing endoribonuclease RAMP protein Cas6 [Bryobacteraceae bacterium]